jgi:outer membrane protein assembly factor BamB
VPDATSPVTDGKHVFIVNSEGMLSCFDLQTGKVVWQHEYEDKFYASPTIAGNVMILQGRKGNAYLIEPSDAFKEIGKADIGEECGASPVPVGNRVYLRGKSNLFCIEGQAP